MKKLFVLLFGFLFGITSAQTESKSLLWKISGNGLTEPSYVFGTIHITCDATLPQKVKDAMIKTNQLCLELDMDNTNIQTEMMGGMMMKDGVTMQSLVSKEDFEIVDAFLTEKLGFSAKMLNTIKPFMVSAMLYPKMLECDMQTVEGELMKIAKIQNEETIGLETVTEQLNVFDAIPYKDQMYELVKTAKSDLSRDSKELNEMLELYKNEDVEALYTFIKNSENVMTSQFEEQLLTNRNQNWISRIEKIANEKPTFFGVGAGHLGGELGVIKLLRKKGFTVESVH